MTRYLQTAQPLDKAGQLLRNFDAVEVAPHELSLPTTVPNVVLVCVVQNGPFDAAAVVEDERDLRDFSAEDGRPKRWLLVNRTVANDLAD